MDIIKLSERELQRLEIIQSVLQKHISITKAAEHLALSRSQVHRLVKRYQSDGAAGLASARRGKPSNRRYSDALREHVLHIVEANYHDFGPTLAAEKLQECHKLSISKETMRKWMAETSLWEPRINRKRRIHQPRNRRDCFGELIQIDGSHHWWFEERGPKCALLVYIDDAISRFVHLRFCKSENAFDYFNATKTYLSEYGKPLSFYSDKHAVFRTTHASKKDATTGMTQFGRALNELNIDIICANTPQAKGRVERANKTLQDRLVKELRLQKIDCIKDANAFVPTFMLDYNSRFAKEPRNPKNMHRPFTEHDSLDGAMCHKEERTISNTLTLRYDKVLFILETSDVALSLARKRVTVCDYPDGRLEIQSPQGITLPYRTFDKLRSVNRAEVVENKRLDHVLDFIATRQEAREIKRSQKAPRRTGQTDHMF